MHWDELRRPFPRAQTHHPRCHWRRLKVDTRIIIYLMQTQTLYLRIHSQTLHVVKHQVLYLIFTSLTDCCRRPYSSGASSPVLVSGYARKEGRSLEIQRRQNAESMMSGGRPAKGRSDIVKWLEHISVTILCRLVVLFSAKSLSSGD